MRPMPSGSACQALVQRLTSTCWIWVASDRISSGSSLSTSSSAAPAGKVARNSAAASRISGASGRIERCCGWRRLKARICCTRLRARVAAFWICSRLSAAGCVGSSSSRASATLPRIAARMLLKSWAMPPARVPTASSFCDSRSCASSVRRFVSDCRRELMSRRKAVNSLPESIFRTVIVSSTGNVWPSRCCASISTSRSSIGPLPLAAKRASPRRCASRKRGGMIVSCSSRPIACAALQPNSVCARAFQPVIRPAASIWTTASSAFSTIAR